MGVRYIETYQIPGVATLGIEDYEDGAPAKDHFFPEEYKKGKAKRFHCWANGCGIGEARSLQAARVKLYDYAKERLAAAKKAATEKLDEANDGLQKLGDDDVFNLGRFLA